MTSTSRGPKSPDLLIGIFAITVGAGLSAMIFLHPERLQAPAWVAYLACLLFVIAGAAAIARRFGQDRLGEGFACLILLGMLTIGGWIALAPGARQCVVSGWPLGGLTSEGMCRGVFGLGAFVVALMLFHALGRLARPKSRD